MPCSTILRSTGDRAWGIAREKSRLWTEFWNEYFAHFEAMNLGPVSAVPQYLVARGVPEPAGMVAVVGLAWLSRSRRRAVDAR